MKKRGKAKIITKVPFFRRANTISSPNKLNIKPNFQNMKISTLILGISFMLIVFKTSAQSKFYVGAEANFIQNQFVIQDEGNAIGDPNFSRLEIPGVSFIVGYNVNSIFSLETGIATRPAKNGYSMEYKEILWSGSYSSESFSHIPLRIRASIPLVDNWLYGTASIGTQFSFTNMQNVGAEYQSGTGEGRRFRNDSLILSTKTTYFTKEKLYLTVSAEIGIEYRISNKFNLYTSLSYNRGFTELRRVDLEYQYKNEPVRKASVKHEGTYISPNFGIRYRFW